ncbi:MAG: helix-turn-helix transcriptional regulator [Elusimicrobia bacterium]|nr:helix-turn-helix transcriptional regulator [Elusimicrobiota bacterium]
MEDIYRKVGLRVRARRRELGWTLEELGEACGLHPSFVGQIERGVKKASLRTVAALAAALRIGVGVLVDDTAFAPEVWEARIGALLRDKSSHQKEILYSTLRHLSRELKSPR